MNFEPCKSFQFCVFWDQSALNIACTTPEQHWHHKVEHILSVTILDAIPGSMLRAKPIWRQRDRETKTYQKCRWVGSSKVSLVGTELKLNSAGETDFSYRQMIKPSRTVTDRLVYESIMTQMSLISRDCASTELLGTLCYFHKRKFNYYKMNNR